MAQKEKQRQASKNNGEMLSWLSLDSQGLNRRETGPHESLPHAFSMRGKKPTQVRVQAVNSVLPPSSGIKCTEVITQLRKPAQGTASGALVTGRRHPTAGSRVLGVGRMGPPDPLQPPSPDRENYGLSEEKCTTHPVFVVVIKMQLITG